MFDGYCLRPIDILAGSSVVRTYGHRRKNRGWVLQVHGGHRGDTRRWPTKGHEGAERVVELRDKIGQDIAISRRAPGRHQAVQPNENHRSSRKVPKHTLERVSEQIVEPVDNTLRRHNNCKLTEVLVGSWSPTLQYAQKVNILQRIRTISGRLFILYIAIIIERCNIKSLWGLNIIFKFLGQKNSNKSD